MPARVGAVDRGGVWLRVREPGYGPVAISSGQCPVCDRPIAPRSRYWGERAAVEKPDSVDVMVAKVQRYRESTKRMGAGRQSTMTDRCMDTDYLQEPLRTVEAQIDGASHDLSKIVLQLDPSDVPASGRMTIDLEVGSHFYLSGASVGKTGCSTRGLRTARASCATRLLRETRYDALRDGESAPL